MLEEFNVGSGSIVGRPKAEVEAESKERDLAWERAISAPFPEAVQNALTALEGVDDLLKKQQIEDARQVLAGPRVQILGLRISPSRREAKAKGAWVDVREPALQEARSALQQLEEWCFEHSIVFFNSADLKQVNNRPETKLAMDKAKDDLDEPLEFLNQGRDSLRELLTSSA